MTRGWLVGLGAALLLSLPCGLWAVEPPPVKVIFDTDMATDCDDAGAMAVLHALADRGECDILATVVSSRNPWSVAAVDVINTYYGRPQIPLGVIKGTGPEVKSAYTERLAKEFPHAVSTPGEVPEAAGVYRDVLEKQPDHSVVVVTVGYLGNLQKLLDLPASEGHPGGLDLVRQKVATWVCMGGNFIGSPPKDDLKLGNVNFQRDATAAFQVVTRWPGPVVFVGREVASVPSGVVAGQVLTGLPETNPVRQAYAYYHGGQVKKHHVADLATVLYAVRGAADYWDISPKGRMDLHPNMTFDWIPAPDGNQAYLLKKHQADGTPNDGYIERVLDGLLVQPPAAGKK